ncbi:FAD-dependent monooxygenase [Silvibacterium sp.]|uniref:FAD-dependent monooxygenase n=1 Tax=Silvibacterium sp. TaxID=1964179 RepID=UPI0039E71329
MHKLGYAVTVVEVAQSIRRGGTPVDIREGVIDVVRRMGLLEEISARSLPPRPTEFLDTDGTPLARRPARYEDAQDEEPGWEIERDVLLDLLYDRVKHDVEFLFADSVISVEEQVDEVAVGLASGIQRSFSLLLGCDGTHSAVRRMCFGEEADFSLFLQNYFSLTIVDKLLIPENSSQMFNRPGKTVMLNAYNGKTDIAFCFFSAEELAYDRRDRNQQKQMILDRFAGESWRVPELLGEIWNCDNFYFDKLCQIRMSPWSKGRVALVGDAGYCPSPAAGMGGSMAILGAAALAEAFEKHPDDFRLAFQEYDQSLRPVVNEIQTAAIDFGLRMFAPTSEEAIRERNDILNGAGGSLARS